MSCQRGGKFAVAYADGKALDELGDRVFAIGPDQFGEGCKQARLREAITVDAIMSRFRPGFAEIAERGLLLLVIGQQVAGDE